MQQLLNYFSKLHTIKFDPKSQICVPAFYDNFPAIQPRATLDLDGKMQNVVTKTTTMRRRSADVEGPTNDDDEHTFSQSINRSSTEISHRRKPDRLSLLLWIFLITMTSFELMAYHYLAIDYTNPNNDPAPPRPNAQPTKTMEPTTRIKGFRTKHARAESWKNSKYWKTATPDALPPLPPDQDEDGKKLPPVIAYVITLTKCDENKMGSMDGAAVLLHSIRRNSYGWKGVVGDNSSWPMYGGRGGRYRYRAYAIVTHDTSPENPTRRSVCAQLLRKLGYVILHKPPLVPLFPIKPADLSGGNEFFQNFKTQGYVGSNRSTTGPLARPPTEREDTLRRRMFDDGCCGYLETLKLHVYGMIEHPLAVHLDMDSLLLRPMDDLFDAMLGVTDGSKLPLARGPKTKTPDYTKPIDAAFTRDYNSVKQPGLDAQVGYQGGFLVVKPSLDVLERYREILRRGEFILDDLPNRGWGGKFGAFYGGYTFQGMLPYYYEMIAPVGEHNEIELDRCIYNQMGDNPRKTQTKYPQATPLDRKAMGYRETKICRDGRKDCSDTDCQRVHPKESITTHFTFCKKPWDCSTGLPGTVALSTCRGLLYEWYAVRRELEDWWISLGKSPTETSYWKNKTLHAVKAQREEGGLGGHYNGYCTKGGGPQYYLSMVEPDKVQFSTESLQTNDDVSQSINDVFDEVRKHKKTSTNQHVYI